MSEKKVRDNEIPPPPLAGIYLSPESRVPITPRSSFFFIVVKDVADLPF